MHVVHPSVFVQAAAFPSSPSRKLFVRKNISPFHCSSLKRHTHTLVQFFRYSNSLLSFGTIDLGLFPNAASKFGISLAGNCPSQTQRNTVRLCCVKELMCLCNIHIYRWNVSASNIHIVWKGCRSSSVPRLLCWRCTVFTRNQGYMLLYISRFQRLHCFPYGFFFCWWNALKEMVLLLMLQKLLCQHFELDRLLLDYINGS